MSRYQSRVYTWIDYDIGWFSRWIKPIFQWYTRVVIEQDVVIMRWQGDNFHDFDEGPFRSTQADEHHLLIDRLREIGRRPGHVTDTAGTQQREREFWI